MSSVVDELVPVKEKVVREKTRAPWYDENIRMGRRLLRQYERKWCSSGLEVDKQIYHAKRVEYHKTLADACTTYHWTRIQESDQKHLFSLIGKMAGRKKSPASILPEYRDPKDFFCKFVCSVFRRENREI